MKYFAIDISDPKNNLDYPPFFPSSLVLPFCPLNKDREKETIPVLKLYLWKGILS